VAAAKAVEERCLGQPQARGPRAKADAQLLERFKSKDYYDTVIDAWTHMEECAPTAEQEQQVIEAMLEARFNAERVPQLAADGRMKSELEDLKEKADALYSHFEHTSDIFYEKRRDDVLRLLSWIKRRFDKKLKDFSEKVAGPTVTRELWATTGPGVVFMNEMSKAMLDIYGTPLDATVASLTDVAFECAEPTTPNRVRQARLRRGIKRIRRELKKPTEC
jgi:hypothetical protein